MHMPQINQRLFPQHAKKTIDLSGSGDPSAVVRTERRSTLSGIGRGRRWRETGPLAPYEEEIVGWWAKVADERAEVTLVSGLPLPLGCRRPHRCPASHPPDLDVGEHIRWAVID